MKKLSVLSLLLLFLLCGTLFSQNNTDGRNSALNPMPVKKEKKREVKHDLFVSDLDEPGSSKQLIAEDLYVSGNIGLGADMTNGTAFGFNTLFFRENNLRIMFEDNSASASFPANDWMIEINASANGGDNYYAIQDVTSGTYPYKIMAGASNNSLLIADNSHIGFGTASPVLKVHAVRGDTPGLRLEQDGSSGWTPQSWDLAGNETNFFIRDVTNSSHLVFRIQPGAPTDALTIKSTGNVGLGTWSPTEILDVVGNVKMSGFLRLTPLLSAPGSPTEGDIYMDGNDHQLKVYNGTVWESSSDNQDLLDATLTGTILEIDIENGASVSVDLQALIDDLEARVAALEAQVGIKNIEYKSARLFQNTPNPYENQTNINYYLPEDVEKAILQIADVRGNIIKEILISERGKGSVIIDESHTKSGTYFYGLVLDGKKTASKIMVKVN